jgi:glycosyltransferase involved in cell wall biosynthesis
MARDGDVREAGPETVTLAVPAYRGGDLIAETLASVRAQTHRDLRVLISVDGPDRATEEACRPFLDDPRFDLVVQPQNLGWVGNFNWLVDRADTAFWCYMQQDDLIDPTYLSALVSHARAHPQASVVYCDMQTFGDREQPVTMPSVGGSSSGRQLALIHDHFAAVALRGICRLPSLRDAGRLRTHEVDDFASDAVWMSAMARAGELVRVPETLYRKRFHGANVHTAWARWPEERRVLGWIVHCTEMLDEAMACEADVDERRLLYDAVLLRLTTARRAPEYLPDSARTAEGRTDLLRRFFRRVRTRGRPDLPELLGTDWPGLRRLTRRWHHGAEPRGPA